MKPIKPPHRTAPQRGAPPATEINALVALFSSGRYADAAAQAKPLTQRFPQHPFGWKVWAAALSRMGRHADALEPMQRAVALSPTDAEAHYNLGTTLNALGRHSEAERSFRQATQLAPGYAPAHCSVGNALQSMGRLQEALASYRRATELAPDYAEAHSNLANALQALGQLDQAEASCRAALQIKPDYPQALCNLGNTLHDMGRLEEAEASYNRALQVVPTYADALSNLGNTLQALGRPEEAVASYRRALSINPMLAQAHSNLANTLHSLGRLDEAETCCRNALQFKPDFAEVYSNLGNALQAQGRLDEAIASYRRALELKPDFASAHSNLLFTLNYHPDLSGDDILAAYRAYERQFAQPHYASWRTHGNDRSTQRRMRVGYVSPAFQSHAVRHFLEPLLARHDPAVVEVFAYAELAHDDAVTARYQRYVAHWVPTRGMSDEALAARIRADAIDILVDVAGHTGGNRLQVFARKPAPVSLHWLDFGYTTGLTAIDYYLTDWATVPQGGEALFSETPWRLDGPALVFRPAEGMGAVSALPATSRGFVTFGTLTRAVRINHRTVRAWAHILQRVAGSQLVIDSRDFRSVKAQEALIRKFVDLGIDRERLKIGCHSPPWDVLRGIDIGLDCFPHNSGTTLFESLYMGVPFVTLAGRPSVGRVGCAILGGLGHPEWGAHSEDEYVTIACELAVDLPRLQALRAGLRAQMQASALMDEAGFARRVEAAYRLMFERWALNRGGGLPSGGPVPSTSNSIAPRFLFKRALSAHTDGQLDLAEQLYRELLESTAEHVDAKHNLGALLLQRGQTAAALPYFKAALEAAPQQEQYWRSYVEALIGADQALRAYQTMTQGIAHGWRGPVVDRLLERFTALLPDHGAAWRQWGTRLFERGELARAEPVLRHALQLDDRDAQAHHQLAWTLRELGRCQEALACAQMAVDGAPDWSDAHNTLGSLLFELGRLDEAEQRLRQAIRLLPGHAQAHNNLGNALSEQRQLAQALDCYRNAVRLDPGYEGAWSNLLFTLNYHPELDAQAIFAGYEEWAARWSGVARVQGVAGRRMPSDGDGAGRRLRVGYVSPDFCAHSCVHFLEPLLAHHDRSRFELFAYVQLRREDEVTQRYRRQFEHWRPTVDLSDDALAAQIAADGIDILVDLAGHTAGNRLGVFAHKPAPVSVSWLGFGYTTGLRAIDYYLCDWGTVPPGSEALFSETPWRLDGPGLVYRPAPNMGAVSALPARRNGHVTFGTLTRAIRINAHTVRVWADILRRVSSSELVVDSPSFRHPWAQDALAREFVALGISRQRLHIGCHSPPWDALRGIDIGLDCFPHNSGTTLFESLYLGVPFVTLAGRPSVGRLGASILQSVGLPEWIAHSEEDYVDIAVAMAADHVKLASLRSRLRAEMESGPLMDEAGFARKVEAAYRSMFQLWVDRQSNDTASDDAQTHVKLGNGLKDAGRLAEAASSYQQALMHDPNCIEACCNLGVVLQVLGRLDEAQTSYRRTLQLDPDCAPAHNNLGTILQTQGRLADAESSFRHALRVAPQYAEAWSNLGSTLHNLGRLAEAQACCHRALQLRPDYADAHNNLGNTLQAMGKMAEAEACCRAALRFNPHLAAAHNNLGNTLLGLNRLVEAQAHYRAAVDCRPDFAQAHSSLAVSLAYLSDYSEVVAASDTALRLAPNDESIWEQRLYNLSYHPDLSAEEIYAEFVRWGDRFPTPVRDFSTRDRTRGRRLRIGYVSPDFRRHTSRFFFWPLFANHDPSVVELVAYSNVAVQDDVTQDFKGLFAHWRDIRGVSDQEVADLVQRDQIDILVDCCNHMRDARLGVFALKPAPIQVTWLGAAWTTGLKAVDYALIDPYMAPEGTLTRETIVRLPHCFVAYRPPEPTPEVAPPPCLKNGFITFGYSGRSERLNHHTFRVWGEILRQNPSARLMLDFRSFADPATQAHYRQFMSRQGMDASRVIMRNSANIFEGLKDFDILLDCFPHSGGTMLFDALWMGVPILTLAGRPPVGRIGTSLMMNLELPQWVAHSHADYLAKALSLAQDRQALSDLRTTMRERLQRSPIMNGVGFARGVESAYRRMFQVWSKG